MNTYTLFKNTAANALNWDALINELIVIYVDACKAFEHDYQRQVDVWKMTKNKRLVAMEVSNSIVHEMATVSVFIPPSPETIAWGGFLGGNREIYMDNEKEEKAFDFIKSIYDKHLKG